MKMLRWNYCITSLNKIQNGYTRGRLNATKIAKEIKNII